ncbi:MULTISPECIES: nucleoside permease [Arenibacter]|uniref:nucleoside permease n=1 Tax=Arenibacter TaxID=178469 RepID=UPI0008557508|nr:MULTISPECIES: nucleoside permease [Arenibacter]GBF20685.1 putative nucleoside transporter YegT [Arenibacter sp. NBRC 103722]
MNNSVRLRLSVLMLLEYFIWGAWYVTMGTYLMSSLEVNATQVGAAYANLSIAAIISPFFVGLVADRFFSAQKVLGTLHLMGAATLYFISTVEHFQIFWWLILLYTLLYMPTMSLVNSISFSQMEDPDKEFPRIRVLGTLGWIAAGLLIGFMELETSYMTFRIAAYCSLLLGILSFFLPSTPPTGKSASISAILGLDALVLFKKRSFVVFFVSSILVCIPLAFYYNFANPFLNDVGMENAAAKMTLGQVSELLFMLLMPLAFRRLGIKKMMLIGIFAWVARYLLFAYGDIGAGIWMLYFGIILHGVCYDFFFVSGQIYIDKKSKPSFRNSAQGLITFATYGVGMFIGSFVSGAVTDNFLVDINGILSYQWESIWLVPAIIALLVGLIFMFFFREKLVGTLKVDNKMPHILPNTDNKGQKDLEGGLADSADPKTER